MCHFCSNIYFILAFVQNFNHFDSQPLQTLEWIFVAKDFCTFAGIYVGPCRMSYILLPKISNFRNVGQVKSHIQAVRYQTVPSSKRSIYFFPCTRIHLSTIPIKAVFLYFQIFSHVYYDWILSIEQHVNFPDLVASLRLSTFCIIFPTFLRTGISPLTEGIFN